MCLHVLFGCLLGGGVVLVYLSSNGTLQKYLENKVQQKFAKDFGCVFESECDSVNWLHFSVRFSQVKIQPIIQQEADCNQEWSMQADALTVSCSWWALLTSGCLKISGEFSHMKMHEEIVNNKDSGLLRFVKKLFIKSPSSWIVYDWMAINDALLVLKNSQTGLAIEFPYVCNIGCEKDSTRIQLYLKNGSVVKDSMLLLEGVSGSLICDLPSRDVMKNMNLQTHINLKIVPFAQKGSCFFSGSMRHGLGSFSLKNEDESFVINPIQLRASSKKCLLDASVLTHSNLCKQLNLHDACKDLHGLVQIDFRGDLYDFYKTLLVDVCIEELAYKKDQILKNAQVFVQYQKSGNLLGHIFTQDAQWFEFTMQKGKELVFEFCNSKELSLYDSYWKVPAQECLISVKRDSSGKWVGSYKMNLCNSKIYQEKKVSGDFVVDQKECLFTGLLDDIVCEACVELEPQLCLKKLKVQSQEGKQLLSCWMDEQDRTKFFADVEFAFIKNIAPDSFKSSFAQEGQLQFEGLVKDGIYYSRLKTDNANIRLPKIYNVVRSMSAACEMDFYNRSIVLKDIQADLHEGQIVCSQASFYFDASGKCYFMYVPLLLHDVLLSWDKGIFMLLSGGLLLHKPVYEDLTLTGQMIIEKSQLKENIFSSEFQETFFGKMLEPDAKGQAGIDCHFDMSIFTKELIQVSTSFLSAKARVDVALQGSLKKPELSGGVELVSGTFDFPYKPLDIIDGKVFFFPDQQFDPLIEVLARGKLKRFGVSMRATGSIFDPHVQFEATPYLTEEQIMSLLLLGIEDSSLSIMVPALLTQKFKDILFGPALGKSILQSRFDRLLSTFKYFRFLPQFTNQAGRGGMRAIFEVDVTDHLHGRADLNFMHLEDTKFDIDFAVSDDVTLRAQKDGPSTYGGEIEFRWKFN